MDAALKDGREVPPPTLATSACKMPDLVWPRILRFFLFLGLGFQVGFSLGPVFDSICEGIETS